MSRVRLLRRLFAALLIVAGLAVACANKTESGAVHVVTADAEVGPVLEQYIDRALDRAEKNDARLVVLRLDTPGGLSSSMRNIVQRIEASDVPVAVYVWPPGGRAASAGTFITLAGHLAVMAPNTSIGAASAINSDGSDIEGTLGRKVENDAVAFIRGIADLRGRNAGWAEQAVREAVAVDQAEAVRLDVVDYVATDLEDLLRQADGRQVEVQPGRVVSLAGVSAASRVYTDMTAWERLLAILANPTIASILIAVGFFGIIAEISNPGTMIPGVVGAIALLLGFLGFGVLPVDAAGLALMAVGIALIALELFVPGGILGLGGLVALVLGALIAFRDTPSELRPPLSLVALLAFLVGGMFISMAAAVARVRRMTAASGTGALIGLLATARTPLSPEGYVSIQGERWRAVMSTGSAHEGERVRIVGAHGLRLEVEPAEKEPTP